MSFDASSQPKKMCGRQHKQQLSLQLIMGKNRDAKKHWSASNQTRFLSSMVKLQLHFSNHVIGAC
jgi:hypothetical protein